MTVEQGLRAGLGGTGRLTKPRRPLGHSSGQEGHSNPKLLPERSPQVPHCDLQGSNAEQGARPEELLP